MEARGIKTRWAAIGAAVAVTLGAGGIGLVSATSPAGAVAYLPLDEPCRAADTRPDPQFNIGPRNTPLGADDTHTINANDGDCAGKVAAAATSVLLNVTAVGATAGTFLTIWASGPRPDASSLNPSPGQPPVPNAVTTAMTGANNFEIFNRFGSVHVIVDVVGYFIDHNHDDRYYTEAEADAVTGGLDTRVTALEATIAPLVNSVAAFAGGNQSVALSSTDLTVRSVSLMPPANGTIIVTSQAYLFENNSGDGTGRCSITTGTAVDGSALQIGQMDAGASFETIAGTRGYNVTAGVLFTANLVCDETGGEVVLLDSSMTAIFAPS